MKMFSWTTAIIISLLLLLIAPHPIFQIYSEVANCDMKGLSLQIISVTMHWDVNQCVKNLQQNGFIGKYDLLDILIFPDVMKVSFIHQAKKLGYINGFEAGR